MLSRIALVVLVAMLIINPTETVVVIHQGWGYLMAWGEQLGHVISGAGVDLPN